jgi:hypothetical protein
MNGSNYLLILIADAALRVKFIILKRGNGILWIDQTGFNTYYQLMAVHQVIAH